MGVTESQRKFIEVMKGTFLFVVVFCATLGAYFAIADDDGPHQAECPEVTYSEKWGDEHDMTFEFKAGKVPVANEAVGFQKQDSRTGPYGYEPIDDSFWSAPFEAGYKPINSEGVSNLIKRLHASTDIAAASIRQIEGQTGANLLVIDIAHEPPGAVIYLQSPARREHVKAAFDNVARELRKCSPKVANEVTGYVDPTTNLGGFAPHDYVVGCPTRVESGPEGINLYYGTNGQRLVGIGGVKYSFGASRTEFESDQMVQLRPDGLRNAIPQLSHIEGSHVGEVYVRPMYGYDAASTLVEIYPYNVPSFNDTDWPEFTFSDREIARILNIVGDGTGCELLKLQAA